MSTTSNAHETGIGTYVWADIGRPKAMSLGDVLAARAQIGQMCLETVTCLMSEVGLKNVPR